MENIHRRLAKKRQGEIRGNHMARVSRNLYPVNGGYWSFINTTPKGKPILRWRYARCAQQAQRQ